MLRSRRSRPRHLPGDHPPEVLVAVGVPASLAKDGAVQTLRFSGATLTVTDPASTCGADLEVQGDWVR